MTIPTPIVEHQWVLPQSTRVVHRSIIQPLQTDLPLLQPLCLQQLQHQQDNKIMGIKVNSYSRDMDFIRVATDQFAAFAFVAKKSGHNIDAKTSEKITDGARGLFEKLTGYVLPAHCANMNISILLVSQKESQFQVL
jgi:hypothetical protein